jgi:hypothetical protein
MGEGTVTEEEKKAESEVTPEGAVEIQEEDLDQASGGAIYMKPADPTVKLTPTADSSLKQRPTLLPVDQNCDMKKL